MTPAVEGGTVRQRELLAEILAGLGATAIELVRLEELVEAGATRGTSVRLDAPDPPSIRVR